MKTKLFRQAFEQVSGLAQERSTLPILNCVKLSFEEGRINITATDLDAYAMASCECDMPVFLLDPICVNAKTLGALLNGEDVKFKMDEQKLVVKSIGEARLPTMDAAEFPAWPKAGKELILPANDLADCLHVAWATDDKQIARPACGGVSVELTAKSMRAGGFSGMLMAVETKLLICPTANFLFPAKHALLLGQALQGGRVLLSDNFVEAKNEKLSVAVKLMDMPWFPVDKLLEVQRERLGIIDAKAMLDALTTIEQLAGENQDFTKVSLVFTAKELVISYQGDNSYTTSLPGKYQPAEIMFNCKLARKAFKNCRSDESLASLANNLVLEAGDTTTCLALLTKN